MKISGKALLLLIVVAYSGSCFANSDENKSQENHLTMNLSIFYPLSINKNDSVSTNFNLSWIYGKVGSVYGVDLSGCVSQVQREVQGFEAAGIMNIVGGNMKGFQAAGVVNYVGSNFEGIQSAGVYNHAKGNVSFFQAAGVANNVEGNFEGFQTSGVANILKGDLTGLQASTVNVAGDVDGVQVSVVNIAKEVKGVQIGVVNIAKKIDGIPIGLVNYAEEGKIHPVAWWSNIILSNVGVKFAVNDYFYSIFSVGYNNQSKDVSKSTSIGYTMGLHFPFQNRIFIDCDLGSYLIDNDELFKSDEGVKNQIMLQERLIIGYEFTEKLSVFAGIGLNYALDHDQAIADAKSGMLLVAGLQLF